MPLPSKVHLLNLYFRYPLYIHHLIYKKIIFRQRFNWIKKNGNKDEEVPLPLVYKLILNWRCNLKCKMCMLWGDNGWRRDYHEQNNAIELDWGIIEKLCSGIGQSYPSFILSGGEPLLYSRFHELAVRLRDKKCFTTVCTNGTLLDKFVKAIENNPYLIFLISLDGLEQENDMLRGKGVYKKVVDNIRLLKSLRRVPYLGVQFTIRPENVNVMYQFCGEMVKLGIDWILFNPCWFVSRTEAEKYQELLSENFNVMPKSQIGYLFEYNLDTVNFVKEYERIEQKKWPIQISCYLKSKKDILSYVNSSQGHLSGAVCWKQWVRMDILPDGKVTPCVQFPDLLFGDLHKDSVADIWNSAGYAKFRTLMRKQCLSVCGKCNNIYLYDTRRKYL